jgi:hypothetical protein
MAVTACSQAVRWACNFQSGLLVAGLEGDLGYFYSNPWFSDNTSTLSDGVRPFTITQSVTTNVRRPFVLALASPPTGILPI